MAYLFRSKCVKMTDLVLICCANTAESLLSLLEIEISCYKLNLMDSLDSLQSNYSMCKSCISQITGGSGGDSMHIIFTKPLAVAEIIVDNKQDSWLITMTIKLSVVQQQSLS